MLSSNAQFTLDRSFWSSSVELGSGDESSEFLSSTISGKVKVELLPNIEEDLFADLLAMVVSIAPASKTTLLTACVSGD